MEDNQAAYANYPKLRINRVPSGIIVSSEEGKLTTLPRSDEVL